MTVPTGAVDCHVHVFDPARFAFADDAPYRPTPAECGTADDLAAVLDAHAIERAIVVTPTAGYGDDNRCMLDALERLGARARGIARVPIGIAPQELDALAAHGVVGVRVDMIALGLAPLDDPAFGRLLDALAERDLILDLQAEGDQWCAIAPVIAATEVRVAIDHMGRPRPEAGTDAPGFRAILRLAKSRRAVVKLSGADRFSRCAAPHDDVLPFTGAIVGAFGPDHLVWGSDWPFVRSARRVDYGPALRWLERIVGDDALLTRILRDTPARWFRFDA
ncbi:MAG TPA: amidohydrolase family protein [Casimicrobiaceae bacterium]|nr:amidohydrolase family protein [Casimicrobiaceae bacterium]